MKNYEVKIDMSVYVLVIDAGSEEQARVDALEMVKAILRSAKPPVGVAFNPKSGPVDDVSVTASAPVDNLDRSKFDITIR